ALCPPELAAEGRDIVEAVDGLFGGENFELLERVRNFYMRALVWRAGVHEAAAAVAGTSVDLGDLLDKLSGADDLFESLASCSRLLDPELMIDTAANLLASNVDAS